MPTELTVERLREVLSYDAETGLLTWRVRMTRNGSRGIGDSAGYLAKTGYLVISLYGQNYQAHRLVWLYVHGEWPPLYIDHVNRCRSDNRISNLRSVTRAQNGQNRTLNATSKSKHTGVHWNTREGKWIANIYAHGVKKCLGYFDDKLAASDAYLKAKRELHEYWATEVAA
jgi:hypothetical protein